jgi:3',5'-cyclic AMP phosphodiesterase CpdA
MKSLLIIFLCLFVTTGIFGEVVLRFAVASDGHWTEFEDMHHCTGYLARWIRDHEVNGKGLDFLFLNGDLTANMGISHFYRLRDTMQQANVPVRYIRGNHDRGKYNETMNDSVWNDIFGHNLQHDFAVGDYAFIIEDTYDYMCPCDPAATNNNGDRDWSHVPTHNFNWVNERLDHYADKKYVFVLMHINPSKLGGYAIDCPVTTTAIAGHSNVAGIYHGHDHGKMDHEILNDRYYFWDGAFQRHWPLGQGYPDNQADASYRIVEVNDDGSITTYIETMNHWQSSTIINNVTYIPGQGIVNAGIHANPPTSSLKLTAYPNPFVTSVDISVVSRLWLVGSKIRAEVYDISGRKVAQFKPLTTTHQQLTINYRWHAQDQPNGVYTVRVKTDNNVLVKKVILNR